MNKKFLILALVLPITALFTFLLIKSQDPQRIAYALQKRPAPVDSASTQQKDSTDDNVSRSTLDRDASRKAIADIGQQLGSKDSVESTNSTSPSNTKVSVPQDVSLPSDNGSNSTSQDPTEMPQRETSADQDVPPVPSPCDGSKSAQRAFAEDRLVVVFKSDVSEDQINRINAIYHTEISAVLDLRPTGSVYYVLKITDGTTVEEMARKYSSLSEVAGAEPDYTCDALETESPQPIPYTANLTLDTIP